MNIYEIAALADVSIASVSRVINGKKGVRPEARDRILNVVKETGYEPNLIAKELSRKRSLVIGLVLPGINAFFTDAIEAIHDLARERGFGVMIAAGARKKNETDEELESLKLFYQRRVDGVLLFTSRKTESHAQLLSNLLPRLPIVSIDGEWPGLDLPCVLQDHYSGARQAAQYLWRMGHRDIRIFGGPDYSFESRAREAAFFDIWQENNRPLPATVCTEGSYSLGSGYRRMTNLLAQTNRPSAVFCVNDQIAIGALKAVREIGLDVPRDISLIGYDDIEYSSFVHPGLTTVKQDLSGAANQAAQLLLDLVASNPIVERRKIVIPKLIIRGSVRDLG